MFTKGLLESLLVDQTSSSLDCLEPIDFCLRQQYTNDDLKIDDFSKAVHMSESTLRRKCKKVFGVPPSKLLLRYRIEAAKKLLATGKPVGEVSADVGFSTHAHFSTQFKRLAGLPPQVFQEKIRKLTE